MTFASRPSRATLSASHSRVVIPTLTTERLVMRGLRESDFPAYSSFYADASASRFYGGPQAPAQAWRNLAADLGHWCLRGFGVWALEEQGSGAMVGCAGIKWPDGWPRHELTWWIAPGARRRGYALEASRAAIDWAYDVLGFETVETHMLDENVAARGLAMKLGGIVIAREQFPDGIERNIYRLPRRSRKSAR